MSVGFLLVRAERRAYGLPLERVVEVADLTEVLDVPHSDAAVRGLTPLRGRLVPLVHLGALLDGDRCPDDPADSAVLVEVGGRRLCLEVEDAESVLYEPGLPVPPGTTLPCAAGVARTEAGLVPLLDLTALGARITETSVA